MVEKRGERANLNEAVHLAALHARSSEAPGKRAVDPVTIYVDHPVVDRVNSSENPPSGAFDVNVFPRAAKIYIDYTRLNRVLRGHGLVVIHYGFHPSFGERIGIFNTPRVLGKAMLVKVGKKGQKIMTASADPLRGELHKGFLQIEPREGNRFILGLHKSHAKLIADLLFNGENPPIRLQEEKN